LDAVSACARSSPVSSSFSSVDISALRRAGSHLHNAQTVTEALVSVTGKDALGSQLSAVSYGYDPHGRQQTATDARTGATTFSYDDGDRLPFVSGNGQTTSYGYDTVDRQTTITLPDNGVVTNQYWDTGELKKTFGARTYTVEYTYDYAGRLKTRKTWRDFAGDSGTAVTTWNYDANRGFLTSKIYSDSNGTTYSNSVSGRIARRTWARGITTDYGYNNAGDLTAITYSDSTPDVTYTLDRRGRRTSVTWGMNTVNPSRPHAAEVF
jgi:YD repeat-containing protein